MLVGGSGQPPEDAISSLTPQPTVRVAPELPPPSRSVEEVVNAGELWVAYQPLVDLHAGRVFGYEALVRSRAPEYPNPPKLLAAAWESRYLGQLGRYLRRLAVEGCPDYPLFLNIHPDEFSEGWLVRPDDAIMQHGHDVFLEITESVPLSHYQHCNSVLAEVRRRGIRIAVDDLGAGYSNLKYIADLAPEVVKLDRELVAGLLPGSRLHKLVASIVELCEAQGARVVAEGIETAEELRAVIATGVHYAQGYYLARPAPDLVQIDLQALL
jgi:EAL domain-containing protein (putative c-di-GMP-specific phosphodiesterase class I)